MFLKVPVIYVTTPLLLLSFMLKIRVSFCISPELLEIKVKLTLTLISCRSLTVQLSLNAIETKDKMKYEKQIHKQIYPYCAEIVLKEFKLCN